MLKHQITINFGDISFDGHNQINSITINSSIDKKKFEKYFTKLQKTFNPFNEYEKDTLTKQEIEYIISIGFEDVDNEYNYHSYEAITLFLDVMSKVYPDFQYEDSSDDNSIDVYFGYGTFLL